MDEILWGKILGWARRGGGRGRRPNRGEKNLVSKSRRVINISSEAQVT